MSGRIYTGEGDEGVTSLASGDRVLKNHPRMKTLGALDEAGAFVGHAREAVADERTSRTLRFLQHRLMSASARLADPAGSMPAHPLPSQDDVGALESAIDALMDRVGDLDGFVLVSGGEAATRCHLARVALRRAEREILDLAAHEPVELTTRRFLNRSSDLLFAAALHEATLASKGPDRWDPDASPPGDG